MTPISIKEARRKFTELVHAAERGESVVITRRGKKVARLIAAESAATKPLPDLSGFRKSIRIKGKKLSRVVVDRRRGERY